MLWFPMPLYQQERIIDNLYSYYIYILDPYVKFYIGKACLTSTIKEKAAKNPDWDNEKFTFTTYGGDEWLTIEVRSIVVYLMFI